MRQKSSRISLAIMLVSFDMSLIAGRGYKERKEQEQLLLCRWRTEREEGKAEGNANETRNDAATFGRT